MPFTFRFRLIPFVAAVIAVAIGCSLGQWQMQRAADKKEIGARLSARGSAPRLVLEGSMMNVKDVEYRRIVVRGEFVQGWPVYLDNRPYKSIPGFYVLMPLRIAGTNTHVLVQRGWAARDVSDRTKLPAIPTPTGAVEIEGIARTSPGNVLQLGAPEKLRPGAIVQNLQISELAKASGFTFLPVLVEQTADTQDRLVRDWPQATSAVDKHFGYAFQWYALAATAFIFYVVTGFRRERQ